MKCSFSGQPADQPGRRALLWRPARLLASLPSCVVAGLAGWLAGNHEFQSNFHCMRWAERGPARLGPARLAKLTKPDSNPNSVPPADAAYTQTQPDAPLCTLGGRRRRRQRSFAHKRPNETAGFGCIVARRRHSGVGQHCCRYLIRVSYSLYQTILACWTAGARRPAAAAAVRDSRSSLWPLGLANSLSKADALGRSLRVMSSLDQFGLSASNHSGLLRQIPLLQSPSWQPRPPIGTLR